MKTIVSLITILLSSLLYNISLGQSYSISGVIADNEEVIPFVLISLNNSSDSIVQKTQSGLDGEFEFNSLKNGKYTLIFSTMNYKPKNQYVTISDSSIQNLKIILESKEFVMDEVVISGTMEPVSKSESAVPVEVYSPEFFQKNPNSSIFESLQNVNGVRPQNNCAVCNTGDIHINGLEGPYTMVLIDGMPIVSGLSTVYGLSGIPMSMIERVEIVKGPASTLYGSEAVGGIINVITKSPSKAPIIAADVFTTTWGEINTDLSTKVKVSKNVETMVGLNSFFYNNRKDNNGDNFTDLATQNRISVFNKWNFKRKESRAFSVAGRYYHEDRFGGELNWRTENRGGGNVYGESIYTRRWELFGTYQLPMKEKVLFQFSANGHDQNSVYGDTWYIADQRIAFGQLLWHKKIGEKHNFLFGSALRYTYYDDNTPATASGDSLNPVNNPTHTYLPGVFVQDEINFDKYHKLLLGLRYDYNSIHGNILTPRANYKITSKNKNNILRFSVGTGYRVVNVFTEEHAALSGAREVVIAEDLSPETSYNANINYVKKIIPKQGNLFLGLDASVFYTYFNNKIFPDYDSNPNQIIYQNLDGYAVSNGISLNIDMVYKNLTVLAGTTLMDVYSVEDGVKRRQELTERFSGTWGITYKIPKRKLSIDYTGNFYSPMELPTLGENDPRSPTSPWYSIQNIQVTKQLNESIEIYGGIKNLLNWTPWRSLGEVDMIQRWFDPFDKNVTFDQDGNAVATPDNPNAMTFDPAYVYGPNQGIRGFIGVRVKFMNLKKA